MTPALYAATHHRDAPRWRRRALRSCRTCPWRKGAWDRGGPRAAGLGSGLSPGFGRGTPRGNPGGGSAVRGRWLYFRQSPPLPGVLPKPTWPGNPTRWNPSVLILTPAKVLARGDSAGRCARRERPSQLLAVAVAGQTASRAGSAGGAACAWDVAGRPLVGVMAPGNSSP